MVPLTISTRRKYFEICVAIIKAAVKIESSKELKPNIQMKTLEQYKTELEARHSISVTNIVSRRGRGNLRGNISTAYQVHFLRGGVAMIGVADSWSGVRDALNKAVKRGSSAQNWVPHSKAVISGKYNETQLAPL